QTAAWYGWREALARKPIRGGRVRSDVGAGWSTWRAEARPAAASASPLTVRPCTNRRRVARLIGGPLLQRGDMVAPTTRAVKCRPLAVARGAAQCDNLTSPGQRARGICRVR